MCFPIFFLWIYGTLPVSYSEGEVTKKMNNLCLLWSSVIGPAFAGRQASSPKSGEYLSTGRIAYNHEK
jgi:hypothetical protein